MDMDISIVKQYIAELNLENYALKLHVQQLQQRMAELEKPKADPPKD